MGYALDVNQAKTIGIGAIVAIVVLGLLASLIISAIVGRIIVLVLTVGLGLLVWNQRANIVDAAKTCDTSKLTFFGYHLKIDDQDLIKQCKQVTSNVGK
jgi:hypothetical protein